MSVKKIVFVAILLGLTSAISGLLEGALRVIALSQAHHQELAAGTAINAVERQDPEVDKSARQRLITQGTLATLQACSPAYDYWAEHVMRTDDPTSLSEASIAQFRRDALSKC